ncbi:energy-coupling factor transporter ATPase [Microbacterium profundi]|uniref:energy-coupling factor transporter ATPase n=1 Tax=Microbacterium profundi TaxID=450380 RepID=UPI0027E1930E|nr:energy-coupling factor transporter ATPase [Microbacterium profundi]
MRSSAPLLRVRDLTLTHADAARPSPSDVNFDIAPGEVVLLLGPSGSGKSTLTLALNGLIPHALPATMTGTVEAGGIDTARSDTATLSTHVAMVFQDPDAQIVTGTVYDEVAFGPENLLLPLDEVRARAEDALRRVGLWQRRDENPDRLSGGGRQRLVIACALAMGSPLLVLDEPTANLDPQGIEDVYAALADVVAAGDRAILLVEHNLDAAMEFVTRTIVLDQAGTVAFDGPVDEILRGHTEELVSMGVWLPAATLTARMLRERGILSHDAPLPLTPVELAEMLSDRVSDGTLSEPIPRGTLSEPIPRGTLSDPIPRGTLSEPIPRGTLSDRVPRGTLSEPIPRGTLSEPIPRGTLSDPILRGTLSEPIPRGTLSEPIPRGTLSEPIPRGTLSEPIPRGTLSERSETKRVERAEGESKPPRPPAPLIRARGLTVTRGRREILHDIDLDIETGSLTAIVGANGAGKTTLIQALAGVVPPRKRQVDVDGLDPATASPRDLAARIGFVFQNPEHQFIAHTVSDELAHGLTLRQAQGSRMSNAEIAQRVHEMLVRFGLEHKADVHPFLLSGGEKRRLSVGTALITGPRVLALDEPTFGQDRARATELLALLKSLRREGTTIVIVTHDLQLVAEHSTHTVVLSDGRVHATGRTDDLFRDEQVFATAGLRLPALQRMLASHAGTAAS